MSEVISNEIPTLTSIVKPLRLYQNKITHEVVSALEVGKIVGMEIFDKQDPEISIIANVGFFYENGEGASGYYVERPTMDSFIDKAEFEKHYVAYNPEQTK